MVVEDELMLQEVYKLVLETRGFSVTTANNGAEALEKLGAMEPDVILLDMLMPVMGGKEFMNTVELNNYPNTKVIVYSNLSDSATEAEMLELGAQRVILKSSMAPDDLVELIENI